MCLLSSPEHSTMNGMAMHIIFYGEMMLMHALDAVLCPEPCDGNLTKLLILCREKQTSSHCLMGTAQSVDRESMDGCGQASRDALPALCGQASSVLDIVLLLQHGQKKLSCACRLVPGLIS